MNNRLFVLLLTLVLLINTSYILVDMNQSSKELVGVIEHQVSQGETLGSIAQAHLGSASMWTQIAKFNHLDDSVLHGGEILLVPVYK